jgi:hypothetical protein
LFWVKLRLGIARESLYASILIVPRRKTGLIKALHKRTAMAAPWMALEARLERERRGRKERSRRSIGYWLGCRGAAWGGGLGGSSVPCLCYLFEIQKKEKREKRKGRKSAKGRKKWNKNQT